MDQSDWRWLGEDKNGDEGDGSGRFWWLKDHEVKLVEVEDLILGGGTGSRRSAYIFGGNPHSRNTKYFLDVPCSCGGVVFGVDRGRNQTEEGRYHQKSTRGW